MSILAIDVGGTNIKYALVDREDRFFSRGVIPTAIRSLDDFRATIMRIYEPLKEQVEGIAFSMPGIIDAQTGFMYSGGSLNWIHNIAMAGEVSGFLSGVPVSIENDAKAAALAELESGALMGCREAAVVICGTGLGGGIISDGKLLKGKRNLAGEISYLSVEGGFGRSSRSFMGRRCGIASLYRCAARYMNNPIEQMDGPYLFAQAENGNPGALRALHEFCNELAQMLLNIQCLFDPEKIAIGGGISVQSLFLEILREEVEYVKTDCLQEIAHILHPELVPCQYHNDANLLGAVYRLRQNMPRAGLSA